MRFTVASIKAIKPPVSGEYVVYDDDMPGFGLRYQNGGKPHWFVRYLIGGKRRRIALGSYPGVTIEAARIKAQNILAKVKTEGIDPANERARVRSAAGVMFETHIADHVAMMRAKRSKSWSDAVELYLTKHFANLHGLSLDSIELATVAAELRKITKGRGEVAANRARSALSKFFKWCRGHGYCANNPVADTLKNEEDPDRHVIPNADLKVIWKAAGEHGEFGDIVRLLALTLQRRIEISALKTEQVDLEHRHLILPGKMRKEKNGGKKQRTTKNKRWHKVPLCKPAIDILKQYVKPDRAYVFGRIDSGFSGWSKGKKELDATIAKMRKVEPWTLHHLRATGDTTMGDELGVLPHVVEAILNHVSSEDSGKQGVAGVYNDATYYSDRRKAHDAYGEWLIKLVNNDPPKLKLVA